MSAHARLRSTALRHRRHAAVAALCLVASTGLTGSSAAVTGSVHPGAIEIETAGKANLAAGTSNANVFNPAADLDWIKDTSANAGTSCLTSEGIATCNQVGVTSATPNGHWQGVRIVDGIDGSTEQDIFLNGGKEQDLSTWNVGPGSVGSSKYDATQMYLANNQTDLFFGMERSGNNGTTAFDFEFNRNAPATSTTYLPTRTAGDVLFTFEMQGSGGSGSVTPHFFKLENGAYVEKSLPSGTFSTINDNNTTPGEPWGHVNSHGDWVTGNLDRNTFAEAVVNLASVFPGFDACTANNAYVQIRTRSAATDTSDLKDTTKIFNYEFNPPQSPSTQLAVNCLQQFTYSSPGQAASYDWSFTLPAAAAAAGAALSGTGVTGPTTAGNGDKVYSSALQSGTVNVALGTLGSVPIAVSQTTTNTAACTAGDGPYTVTVYRNLGVTATLVPQCNNVFAFSSTVSGGNAPYTYAWTFQKNSLADGTGTWSNVGTSTLASGTFNAGSQGAYRALLTVTDTAGTSPVSSVTPKPVCTANATSNTVNVYDAVGGSTTLANTCAAPDVLSYSAQGTGGNGTYTYAWTIQKNTGSVATPVWTTAHTFNEGPISGPSTGTLDVDTFLAGANGDGFYRALVTITDTQGLNCTASPVSNTVEAAHLLGATASKTSADGTALSVLLTGAAQNGGSSPTFQWQRLVNGTWTNIASATSSTLTYSSFESDATPTATSFTMGGDSYAGKLWTVSLRVRVTRTMNGLVCQADSPAVLVKKVTAVDP